MSFADFDSSDEAAAELYFGSYVGDRNERDERHGHGVANLPNGDTYDGEYKKGLRHGRGEYKFQCGAIYKGEYQNNKKHGQGSFHYPDGSWYEGEWFEDMKQGHGTYVYRYLYKQTICLFIYPFRNADRYEGQFYQDQKHGVGTYTIFEPSTRYPVVSSYYVGNWSNGIPSGAGELVHENHKYQGNWVDGDMQVNYAIVNIDTQLLFKGAGKYVFDNGIEQHGEYIAVEVTDEDAEDEATKTVPTWKATKVKSIL